MFWFGEIGQHLQREVSTPRRLPGDGRAVGMPPLVAELHKQMEVG